MLLLACLLTAACASSKVIIDKRGVDLRQCEHDYAECSASAGEVDMGSQMPGSAAIGC